MWIVVMVAAFAEAPLPSFEEHLGLEAWGEVDALLEAGDHRAAIARADAFCDTVVETAGLRYLAGLAYRRMGRDDDALPLLRRATELDPTYAAPWYDLGEIYLIAGRWDDAAAAFRQVTDQVPTGPHSELGPLRLAEVAAHQGDPEGLERWLREALRRGFSFRDVAHQPQWRGFYADPRLRDSIEKMVTVYGDPEILHGWD